MDSLIGSALFTLTCFLIFLLMKRFDGRLVLAFGVLFAAYLGIDDVLTGLPNLIPAANFTGGHWNWSSKIYSLLLSMLVIFLLKIDKAALGFSLRQNNLKSSLLALGVLTLLSLSLGFVFRPDAPNLETLAFQALMPGLAEELAYRGIAPALLLGCIRARSVNARASWTIIAITGFAFGVWHGLSYAQGAISFNWMAAAFPMIGGLAYGWLRVHSGSLLLPIIAHSLGNCVFYLSSFAA